jgi:hypothetical protein
MRVVLVCLVVGWACVGCGKKGQPANLGGTSSGASDRASDRVPTTDLPIDRDHDYPDRTDVLYLSGNGSDDALSWDFMINTGNRSGERASIA